MPNRVKGFPEIHENSTDGNLELLYGNGVECEY